MEPVDHPPLTPKSNRDGLRHTVSKATPFCYQYHTKAAVTGESEPRSQHVGRVPLRRPRAAPRAWMRVATHAATGTASARPAARYGARCGPAGQHTALPRATRGASPSTARRGRTFSHREPSLRCVATANHASRGATDPESRAAPRSAPNLVFSARFGERSAPNLVFSTRVGDVLP